MRQDVALLLIVLLALGLGRLCENLAQRWVLRGPRRLLRDLASHRGGRACWRALWGVGPCWRGEIDGMASSMSVLHTASGMPICECKVRLPEGTRLRRFHITVPEPALCLARGDTLTYHERVPVREITAAWIDERLDRVRDAIEKVRRSPVGNPDRC